MQYPSNGSNITEERAIPGQGSDDRDERQEGEGGEERTEGKEGDGRREEGGRIGGGGGGRIGGGVLLDQGPAS